MLRHMTCVLAAEAHCLRTLYVFVKPTFIKQSVHTAVARTLFSATDKGLPSSKQLIPADKVYSHDTDILLEQLRKAKQINRVLELVSIHVDVMNDNHLRTAFDSIHNNLRDIQQDPLAVASDIKKNPAFQDLCNRSMNRARFLDPEGVISVFKTLTKLHVPCNTYVMQAMLKMLCSHVNDLSLGELIFVNFLLQKLGRNILVDSLKLALPLVLQVQIEQQLDSQNLQEVVNCLTMACKAKLKPATIQKVVSALQRRIPDFTADHATSIIYALFFLNVPVDGYMQLINSAFDILSDNIYEQPPEVLGDFLKMCQRRQLYYKKFFINVSKRAVSERWELHDCYDLMNCLCKLGFFSDELLELLSNRVIANSETVKQHSKYSVLNLTECCTYGDYQLTNVHEVLDVLSCSEKKISSMAQDHPHLYFKLVTSWAMLGYFPEHLLRRVLVEDFLFSAWSCARKLGRSSDIERYSCCLQWALEIHGKGDHFKIPTNFYKAIVQSIQQKYMKSAEWPLTSFLENGLGGRQFFLNGVFTQNGHFIDHLVAMRSGNYPVALDTKNVGVKISHLEDVHLPNDAKMIAIVVPRKEHYCTDPEILKMHAALKIKNLNTMSLSPVVVNYEKWYLLPDREKIPFLMRQIKEAAEADGVSKTLACPF